LNGLRPVVGFTLIGRGKWSGGEIYQRNLFGLMADLCSADVGLKLFLSPEQAVRIGGGFDRFLDVPAIVDARVAGAGEGRRALKALVTGVDADFAALVQAHAIDVMFESAQWFGNRFPVPVLAWIPDFQHRNLRRLFPATAWWKRDIGFRLQTSGRRQIMLSSEDCRRDCETFFSRSLGQTHVVRFSIDLDPRAVHVRADGVRAAHVLPEQFFYLPNQFWSHKNHAVVVEALGLLAQTGRLAGLPPVVMTGHTEDARDPGLFRQVMARAKALGVDSHFRHLGLIPYENVLALNAAAHRLINPSLFEGWSTTVEEAKALGTPMILSDISLHCEQAPDATFFARFSAHDLADCLVAAAQAGPRSSVDLDALDSAQTARRNAHATAFLAAVDATLAAGGHEKFCHDHLL
jgi:glycosyltransferase involved in cell wall biosynthesis